MPPSKLPAPPGHHGFEGRLDSKARHAAGEHDSVRRSTVADRLTVPKPPLFKGTSKSSSKYSASKSGSGLTGGCQTRGNEEVGQHHCTGRGNFVGQPMMVPRDGYEADTR